MSLLQQVCVLILTYNEAPNIARTLDALKDFEEVCVLDSGSTDDTLAIVARYPNARVRQRPFDSHSAQWNYGLSSCGLNKPWVLALDADYELTRELVDEIAALPSTADQAGFCVGFRYCVFGRPLASTLYPPIVALYRRAAAHYVQDGHTQRVVVNGQVGRLHGRILHDDRKPLDRWLSSQGKYAAQEAELLLATPWRNLKLQDKLRRMMIVTPWLVPLYCLTVGRGILDGWAGVFYAFQRGIAEAILAVRLLEIRIKGGP
ncbi:MAG: glycosyltransferase family 2 protein [Ramlibacter sp.]|nr:glycosyltransferase family 2 protein [Ramlibacter sp.]